ncbi:MAG: GYD family protein, partial [Candidatus Rokuibacteriota bacterium]
MPNYVVLYRYTDQGAKQAKETVKRARENRAANEKRGFKIHQLFWTQGRYDLVAIVEAPSEQAMTSGLVNVMG